MIEDVEELGSEFDLQALGQPRGLQHGEIYVVEARPEHQREVAPQVAELECGWSGKSQRVEVSGGIAVRHHRIANQIGTHGVGHVGEPSVPAAENDSERVAALQSGVAGDRPAFEKAVAAEGQFIQITDHKVVPRVEVREAAIGLRPGAVLEGNDLRAERVEVNRLRESVGRVELEPVREALAGGDPQGVVVGLAHAGLLGDDVDGPWGSSAYRNGGGK